MGRERLVVAVLVLMILFNLAHNFAHAGGVNVNQGERIRVVEPSIPEKPRTGPITHPPYQPKPELGIMCKFEPEVVIQGNPATLILTYWNAGDCNARVDNVVWELVGGLHYESGKRDLKIVGEGYLLLSHEKYTETIPLSGVVDYENIYRYAPPHRYNTNGGTNSLVPGKHIFRVSIDVSNRVNELFEFNNFSFCTLKVDPSESTKNKADLTIESVWPDPELNSKVMNVRVRNIGRDNAVFTFTDQNQIGFFGAKSFVSTNYGQASGDPSIPATVNIRATDISGTWYHHRFIWHPGEELTFRFDKQEPPPPLDKEYYFRVDDRFLIFEPDEMNNQVTMPIAGR